ncbi:NADH-quinone oxidoreductase subunit N [Lacibacter sp.]|uniref:NADH-quinone oxidoreductase subunit N n=1 Tax=Lacibacter sp. TaxID=1915409 RepID=UPI002B4B1596|nr:NADH-quinone oxidoreductase subunit N [Lacibacter sp.]HLP36422.1 NADH-quinone oxidoreductase subunit N [Lacibacter sp.]
MNLILISAIWGIVMMFSGLFLKDKSSAKTVALIGSIALLIGNFFDLSGKMIINSNFNGMLQYERFGLLFLTVLVLALIMYILLSGKDVEAVGNHPFEYFALIFFVMSGAGLVALFNNLLILFIGIEIISIPLYILTGSDKRNLKSNEAALKYFLMGSFSTGIMLMGIAFLYGATGSFQLEQLIVDPQEDYKIFMLIGIVMIMVALAFKVSAAPFHFWTPDVYDGAPTVFTSFMATIVKAAVFIGFVNLFANAFGNKTGSWQMTVAIITALTLFIGNITAVYQQSVKRMLAYSSIAQAGFMMFAVFAINDMAKQGLLLYAAAYCFATIGIFAVLVKMKDYTFDGFNGLAKKQPLVALVLTVCLLSLAGIPLTAGFFAKYFVLAAAVKTGTYLWLVIFAVVMAAVSVYYYFRVIQAMYFKEGEGQEMVITTPFKALLVTVAAVVILLGVYPSLLLNWLTLF